MNILGGFILGLLVAGVYMKQNNRNFHTVSNTEKRSYQTVVTDDYRDDEGNLKQEKFSLLEAENLHFTKCLDWYLREMYGKQMERWDYTHVNPKLTLLARCEWVEVEISLNGNVKREIIYTGQDSFKIVRKEAKRIDSTRIMRQELKGKVAELKKQVHAAEEKKQKTLKIKVEDIPPVLGVPLAEMLEDAVAQMCEYKNGQIIVRIQPNI